MKEKKKLPVWAIILIVIGVIAVIGAMAGGDDNTGTNEGSNSTGTTQKKELTLEEGFTASLDDTGYFYYVEGYINNPTDKDYSYVQVTFNSYDKDGNTLGTCLDNNSGLEKGGRWKFKASCLESVEDIASVKLQEITGW